MQARGIFLTVLSAVLYGLNPLFSKTINVGGCNSLTRRMRSPFSPRSAKRRS